MKKLIIMFLLLSKQSFADKPLVFSGRVVDTSNIAIESVQTKFNIKISNSSNCIIYDEDFDQDMSNSNGYFKLILGSGSALFNGNGLDLFRAKNYLCEDNSNWVANQNDIRKVSISVKVDQNPWVNFASDTLNSNAYANDSEYLRGFSPTDFIKINSNTTQTRVDQLSAQYQGLLDLVNGTNSVYAKQSSVDLALSNKQNSLNYSPVNPANNLSELTNPVTARNNLGLGLLAIKSNVSDSDIVNLNWSKLLSIPSTFSPSAHSHQMTDIINLSSNLSQKMNKVDFNCSSSQVLTYISITDSFNCFEIQSGGDLSGNINNATVIKIQGKQVSAAIPQDGDVLQYSASNSRWEPASIGAGAVPKSFAGEIITFPGNCPSGTVLANGQSLDKITNSELFTAYGCGFGCPTGTTFQVPDYRGMFLRMADNGAGIDSGRLINTTQSDDNKNHTHTVNDPGHNHSISDPGHGHNLGASPGTIVGPGYNLTNGFSSNPFDDGVEVRGYARNNVTGITVNGNTTNISINNSGGVETRPKNISVNYCIRLRNAF